jgi:DNA polymerase-3 subunit gamma/tau
MKRTKKDPSGEVTPEKQPSAGEVAKTANAEVATSPPTTLADSPRKRASSYTVVARRYRPQRFEDVVGQDHVVKALRNAIRLGRIAQAYVFCGTRGVGKTSLARIFAKCLNCVNGPTEEPCQTCDICQAIAQGQDVDVIEIDGASNNGVEQVRELRQNAGLRPSRARYKIYYIDEVHMLTTGAFNALLKTLEEPPPHVKFLFATTEAGKIPITVLSRCQRFDFAGITPDVIAETLAEICTQEHVEADADALQIVARRASGSLRDAQSLLDRLMASGSERLTVDVVNKLLGTASDDRLLALVDGLASHDSAAVLGLLEQSSGEGVQPAELLAGIIDFLRDTLVMAVGAQAMALSISPRQRPQVKKVIDRWSVDSIMAALQILSECRARMRGSLHSRLLLELALVRIARLEKLSSLGSLIDRLEALESGLPATTRGEPAPRPRSELQAEPARVPEGRSARPGVRPPDAGAGSAVPPARPALDRPPSSNTTSREVDEPPRVADRPPSVSAAIEPVMAKPGAPSGLPSTPTASTLLDANAEADAEDEAPPAEAAALDLATARKVWPELLKKVGASLAWRLSQVEPAAVIGPDVLVIAANPGYNSITDECGTDQSRAKIEQTLRRLTHRTVTVKYERAPEDENVTADERPLEARRQDSLAADPLVQRVLELFEARPHQLEFDESDTGQPA